MHFIFALSLSNPVQLLISLFKEILKQSSNCSDIPWISCAPHPTTWLALILLHTFYYHTALLYLISAPSTSASVYGSDGSVLFYQTHNCKRNLGQIPSFVATCPACAHSEEAEAFLLIKRWLWEQDQHFWATVLKPNKFLLAAPYQFTWESCWLLQAIGFWWLQCLWPSVQWGFHRKLSFGTYSLLLDKGKGEVPAGHWIYTSQLRHII